MPDPSDSSQNEPSDETETHWFRRLLGRARYTHLIDEHDERLVSALFALVNGTLSIGLLALLAHFADTPLIFPSLGPTAFLAFASPLSDAASPRNAVLGHTAGIVAAWLSLWMFGLTASPSAFEVGVTWPRIGAAAVSLGLTSSAMVLTSTEHPPAGATTLIISLGLMPELWQIPVVLAGVVGLAIQAVVINRLAGLDYPWWEGS